MDYKITLQNACTDKLPISGKKIKNWLELTLKEHIDHGELTVRLVIMDEMTELNNTYRQQNKPTNVLAFPSQLPDSIVLDYPLLGDIVICPEVLKQEAATQNRPLIAHWAHIVIHGALHLLGYDHIEADDAKIMQAEEIQLLAQLKFTNPYKNEDNDFE